MNKEELKQIMENRTVKGDKKTSCSLEKVLEKWSFLGARPSILCCFVYYHLLFSLVANIFDGSQKLFTRRYGIRSELTLVGHIYHGYVGWSNFGFVSEEREIKNDCTWITCYSGVTRLFRINVFSSLCYCTLDECIVVNDFLGALGFPVIASWSAVMDLGMNFLVPCQAG